MAKLGIFAVVILAAAGVSCEGEAWAADIVPSEAFAATAASAPEACTSLWGFIETNSQLTWHGITVFGTIEAGFGWQSHGAPWGHDPLSAPRT